MDGVPGRGEGWVLIPDKPGCSPQGEARGDPRKDVGVCKAHSERGPRGLVDGDRGRFQGSRGPLLEREFTRSPGTGHSAPRGDGFPPRQQPCGWVLTGSGSRHPGGHGTRRTSEPGERSGPAACGWRGPLQTVWPRWG
uniref:Uncharacterized protein n=1 Tax=Molossus molossus TaxID=27622 RepID=A0A7J8FSH4_MOLMO|nr:hypothetical protein HJG59_008452 [Molossus molossus]